MSQDSTGDAPDARVIFFVHEQEGLQQSQYRVVVPVPEAADAWAMKKGTRARRVFVESETILPNVVEYKRGRSGGLNLYRWNEEQKQKVKLELSWIYIRRVDKVF